MIHGIQQDAAGHAVIIAQLGAAVRMLQHGKIVEAAQIRVLRLELRQHLLGDAVHTADCRDNEQIITDADLAVGTAVALEGEVAFRIGNRVKLRDIIVFFLTYEIRFDVMRVNQSPAAIGAIACPIG